LQYRSINFPNNPVSNPKEWIGDKDEPLSGFSWRSGSIRDTTGLDVWNDVFLYTDEKSCQDIAIFVIDTHGLFDKETSSLDNSRIFALGTLISSIQVFNLSGVIQEDQLQYLQSATECAKFSIAEYQEETEKCFQNLVLLIRDWVSLISLSVLITVNKTQPASDKAYFFYNFRKIQMSFSMVFKEALNI